MTVTRICSDHITGYFRFLMHHRRTYIEFNKQLLIGELAGFVAGIGVAEAAASAKLDEIWISGYSSAADYLGSILGFLGVYYADNKRLYESDARTVRIKKILKSALRLWPSVVAADAAFILARPYFHYAALFAGVEAGIAAVIAHFLAFGVFNAVAILSRSIIDYTRSSAA